MDDTKLKNAFIYAFDTLKKDLPNLIGKQYWSEKNKKIEILKTRLQKSNIGSEQNQLCLELLKLVQPHDAARERVKKLILSYKLKMSLVESFEKLCYSSEKIKNKLEDVVSAMAECNTESELNSDRVVFIKSHGIGGAKSIKFKNIKCNINKLSTSTAALITAAHSITKDPHPFVIAVGTLLLIGHLADHFIINISEKDSTVFWGFLKSIERDKQAHISKIIEHTNKERDQIGLFSLTDNEVLNTLFKLKSINMIEHMYEESREIWLLKEHYKIKS